MTIWNLNQPFFIAFQRRCVACSLRPASIIQYNKTLKRFLKIYKADECDAGDVRCWLSKLDVAPATVKIHWMTLRVFFNFLYNNNIIKTNPMVAVEKPRVPHKQMRFFSAEEIKMLLDCWDESTYTGIRNKTMMLLFLGTGIRRAEMAGLLVSDVRWDLDCIFIRGKGGKERTVPMTSELRRIISRYIVKRNQWQTKACKSLFLSSTTGEAMTPAGVWSIFKKSPLTGERISPHSWRHTFSRIYILNGGDLASLQAILGHSSIETTKKYLSLATEDVAIINNKVNPLVNKKWLFF